MSAYQEILMSFNYQMIDYAQLLKSGVIDKINSSLDKLIDEYEDENIKEEAELTKLIDILTEAYKQTNSAPLEKLIKLNRSALQNKTGLFFYF